MNQEHIPKLIDLAHLAGEAILKIYSQSDFSVVTKPDSSPLTQADLASHRVIVDGLKKITPDYPVISEEGSDVPWSFRKTFERYWLVDPLDGTKEFLKRNGEFTVNLALVENGIATFGVVYCPVNKLLYWGGADVGAFKQCGLAPSRAIHVAAPPAIDACWRILGSRSHSSAQFDEFVAQFPEHEIRCLGSSLKLCLIAEGGADLYPRFGSTSEWDTAAGQAILEAAGGQVLDFESVKPLRYNTKESLINPSFIACSALAEPWFSH